MLKITTGWPVSSTAATRTTFRLAATVQTTTTAAKPSSLATILSTTSKAISTSALTATTQSALATAISGFVGKSSVDCKAVCQAVSLQYSGYGMSGSGQVSTYSCSCGTQAVKVQCVGSPTFTQCCKDSCAGTTCPSQPSGWSCPANGGCASGTCSGTLWQEWVAAHNIYRCMHNVPSVSWSNDVYSDANTHFATVQSMSHSDCYKLAPPAGPAGENLFQGTGRYRPMDATKAWYSEVSACGPMPGCSQGATGVVGHFTALIWNGDKTLGCFNNSYNLWGCRYKALDYLSCNTPNYGDNTAYQQNVYPVMKSFDVCLAAVVQCGLPDPTLKAR
jgi:hypothetical protein